MKRIHICVSLLLIALCTSSAIAIAPVSSQQTNTYTAYGPIGTGPYIYMGNDPTTGDIRLVRNDNYWNKDALSSNQFQIQEFNYKYINSTTGAIEALKAGTVDILSPFYGVDVSLVQQPWGDYVAVESGLTVELELNLRHPVYGTGVDTPLGAANLSQAADAARYVRQAISHLVPRQEIVDTVYHGTAASGVVTGIVPSSEYFDTTIQPYSYNVTLAKQLLEQAGYDTTSNSTLFNMTVYVPFGNEARIMATQLIADNLNSVGIATDLEIVSFGVVQGVTQPTDLSMLGKTYAQGGFDAVIISWDLDVDGAHLLAFHSSSMMPPTGANVALWNNTESDRLLQLMENATSKTEWIQYVKLWQQLYAQEQPRITIAYTKTLVVFNPSVIDKNSFTDLDPIYFWPSAEAWVLNAATKTKIVVAQPQNLPLQGFNPYMPTNSYDEDVINELYDGLINYNNTGDGSIYPALATSWESNDNVTWTVHLRQNVTWHDGAPFTADDVKFTYTAQMSGQVGTDWTPLTDYIASANDIQIVDPYTLIITLNAPDPDFDAHVLSRIIIPQHILQNVAYADWATHPFNTAANTYTVTLPQATTAPTATPAVTNNFEQYGLYLAAAAIIAVVAVALVLQQRGKRKTANA